MRGNAGNTQYAGDWQAMVRPVHSLASVSERSASADEVENMLANNSRQFMRPQGQNSGQYIGSQNQSTGQFNGRMMVPQSGRCEVTSTFVHANDNNASTRLADQCKKAEGF